MRRGRLLTVSANFYKVRENAARCRFFGGVRYVHGLAQGLKERSLSDAPTEPAPAPPAQVTPAQTPTQPAGQPVAAHPSAAVQPAAQPPAVQPPAAPPAPAPQSRPPASPPPSGSTPINGSTDLSPPPPPPPPPPTPEETYNRDEVTREVMRQWVLSSIFVQVVVITPPGGAGSQAGLL